MVINGRTFKTFDALLDTLSKKVPLAFGVRTITTPRGVHLVKSLDDLHDGGSYVCSDQKRVKPLNLNEVNRRQVPWNTTRPLSTGRQRHLQVRQFGRRNEVVNGPTRVTARVTVRTPKRLLVIKNKDPAVKRTIVLQRRTAPTFDSLLDYLSQILQFPVLKLFSPDGRRVEGLAALILCSGVVVAAGNEPFRLGNYIFHGTGQMAQVMYMEELEPSVLQPRTQRYIVDQINKSLNGSTNDHLHHPNGSIETEVNPHHTSVETRGTGQVDNGHHSCVLPQDDDIEKSFRVNQDGSMTVEMKVRLTIKEEEMIHWTTTLSRHSLSKRAACASMSELGNSSPDSNNAIAKDSSSISEDDTKEENLLAEIGKGVCFNDKQVYKNHTSKASGKAKTSIQRTPTPGPRHVRKKASVESVKTVTGSGVQESSLGHYSYVERTADGDTTEGYCVVRHSSSSSKRPTPKPRKTASAGASDKVSRSPARPSGVADVLQIQNNGMEVTETVMHIYESRGDYDNYFANEEYSADDTPLHGSTSVSDSKPSTESGPSSSSNDCDIDFSRQPPTTGPLQRQTEEMLSLSSEPVSPTHEMTNNLSTVTEIDTQTAANSLIEDTVKRDKTPKSEKDKKTVKPARNQKSSTSKNSKPSSSEKLSSNASTGKKSLGSSESAKSRKKSKGAGKKVEKPQSKKSINDEDTPRTDSALLKKIENVKITPPKRQSANKIAAKDNGHNVNTPSGRPQMKKNMSDILQPKKSLLTGKKTASKPKTITANRTPTPKKALEFIESVSTPSLNPTPSEIHQYVENWLEKVSRDQVPYEEAVPVESEPPSNIAFQIGGESETDEKNGCQTNLDENYPPPGDAVKKSPSCLSVPLYHEGPETSLLHNDQKARGLCVSMPSVRLDPVSQENQLRAHRSAEAIGPTGSEATSSMSNILSPKETMTPVPRQLCTSVQNIRRASDTNTASNLEKSNSLPDFSTQVTSVFGSSCKAFVSFLSVMTLRDNITGSAQGDGGQSRSTSEAMLMMQSLLKISTLEDKEEQRASLTDLQSRTSSQFRERWKDFQILRERLESEPLSPSVSETEFALDLASEGGDIFEDQQLTIDELMEELNMPQDLRAEISSTIQQARSFYPVEESTFVENERNQSDSEEDVEKFVEECNDEAKSTDREDTCTVENIAGKKQNDNNGDGESDQETDEVQETGPNVKESEVSQTEDEALEVKLNETEENEDQVEEDREGEKAEEDGDTKKTNDDGEELENVGKKREEEREEEAAMEEDEGLDDWEAEKGSVEESVVKEWTEEEMTADEEEQGEKLEEGNKVVEEKVEKLMNEEDTDEREAVEDTEEEEQGKDGVEEEADEDESGEEVGNEEKQVEETEEEEADGVVEETDENPEEQEEEEMEEVIEETEEEKEAENIIDKGEEIEDGSEKILETDEEEELGNITDEVNEEEEEEELDNIHEEVNEEEEEEEEEEELENIHEEVNEEEEEEELDIIHEEVNEEEEEEEEEDMGVVTEERGEEEDKMEENNEEEKADAKVKNTEEGRSKETGSLEEPKETINSMEEESIDAEEEREEDDENELNEEFDQLEKQESKDEVGEGNVTGDTDSVAEDKDCQSLLEEASYLQQNSHGRKEANAEHSPESPTKYSSEGQCEYDKGSGTDNELETDEGGERHEDRRAGLPHPVEISQELLDYVNFALQSSSLTFTYDARGNIRIEPDNARAVQTKLNVIPKRRKDSSYGLKCLPSPNTSDLSDYRPETSESGGYKTQDSLDIVTDSGDEASERPSPVVHVNRTKVSKEDLSYFSAASSLKADVEAAPEATQCISHSSDKDTADGVLIDRGRWLLKENHLIRKSPPISLGMYGDADSTSTDTGQENIGEDSPAHCKTRHNPLVAISSSELEEMAKPQTPKCSYFNMPHGSDSDPFMEDSIGHVGSMSSFASVEFKIPDGKVHPEGEPSAVTQPRRTSSGGGSVVQVHDSLETLRVRCGQYCPIL
ncbi:hypothetical protein F2P81_000424 [Scophthalmus maximus]|uniref:Doublecortin domain-containing protein n=1 Tax=Scophthalmus maximus TaxID=52904 RepID=A0A6A4TVZ8_SCOMX|nr:hypothetical protein F2P81_000424 [Scophthalmus maximus]